MPDQVFSDEGEREMSRLALKAELVTPRIWHLRLFKNDYFPNRTTVLTDLVEATFPNYLAVPMDPALWTDAVTVGGVAVSFWGTNYTQFTCTGTSQLCYGYYVTFLNGTRLLYSQRFDRSQLAAIGTPVVVWPQVTDQSQYAPDPPP